MSLSNTAAATAPQPVHTDHSHPTALATQHPTHHAEHAEHVAHPPEQAREEIKPPEHRAEAPAEFTAAAETPAAQVEAAAATPAADALNHRAVTVMPAVKNAAEVKLFARLLPYLGTELEQGMKLSISSEVTDLARPEGNALKISLQGPMIDANAASIQRILAEALRDHTPVGSLMKAGMTHTLGHTVHGESSAHSTVDFQLLGITTNQYAQLVQALAAEAPAVAPAAVAPIPVESIATPAPHPAATVAAAATPHGAGCVCASCATPNLAANDNPETTITTPAAAHAPLVTADRAAAL